MMIDNEKKMIENNEIITTDTEGIYMRDYQDTLVTREIPNNYGYYNEAGEYVKMEHLLLLIINMLIILWIYMKLIKINRIRLEDYDKLIILNKLLYKGIPMMLGLTQLSEK